MTQCKEIMMKIYNDDGSYLVINKLDDGSFEISYMGLYNQDFVILPKVSNSVVIKAIDREWID